LLDELSLLGDVDELPEYPNGVVEVNGLDKSSLDEGKSSSYQFFEFG
jgi:hypothetical protein